MLNQTNPFLEAIEPFVSIDNLAQRLAYSPLDGIDMASLTLKERHAFLDRLPEEYFEPTTESLEIATRLFRLIPSGYVHRNPTQPRARKITMTLVSYTGEELASLPWFTINARGITIKGITGLGKTYDVLRSLKLIPQCIVHGRSQAAGWARMTQITWLHVPMSHDGSPSGLLLNILCAIDEAVGTQYSQDRSLLRLTNEKLSVRVGVILRNHGVGVLVIDEIQARNFSGRGRGEFTTTFFLRLLNFGIPMVLVGNPLGLEALEVYAQDVRRIGSGGTIGLHPLWKGDFDWVECISPSLATQSVMPEPMHVENWSDLLFRYSGGIRDFSGRLYFSAQRVALDLGSKAVTEEHLRLAYEGMDFSDKERTIIQGFSARDPRYLIRYEDIPWEYYASRWGLRSDQNELGQYADTGDESIKESATDEKSATASQKPVPQRDLENIKRRRTRKVRAASKRADLVRSLSPEDMRGDGLKAVLISGLDALVRSRQANGRTQ